MSRIKKVCVCGAGTMGGGIAQVMAGAHLETIVYDVQEAVLFKAQERLQADLQKLVEKGKLTPERRAAMLHQVIFTPDIKRCTADLIIEAVIEKHETKLHLFHQLIKLNNNKTVFASNTSSLSLTAIAEESDMRDRFLGLHFFNPPPLMKLVEVVYTKYTALEVLDSMTAFVKQLGKTPVLCKDAPGFIVNRVARPYYIESLRLVEEGKASIETIDRLLEALTFKMGPFKLMDFIGNDVNYAVSCSVYEQLNKPSRLRPSLLQKEKVDTGALGKKTGKGYYDYT